MVKRVFVPVLTSEQMRKIESLHDDFEALAEKMGDLSMELNASLAVLRGHLHPEGWMEIVEIED